MRFLCSQQTCGGTRGLSLRGNVAERGQLASVGDLLVNTKKNVRNNGESECG